MPRESAKNHAESASDGPLQDRAVRRALSELGKVALPLQIQEFVADIEAMKEVANRIGVD
jgi:hypothetical protein